MHPYFCALVATDLEGQGQSLNTLQLGLNTSLKGPKIQLLRKLLDVDRTNRQFSSRTVVIGMDGRTDGQMDRHIQLMTILLAQIGRG